MDKPLPDDFDPYGDERVNYGVQNGNNTNKVVWWVLGGLMTLQVGIGIAAVTFVGSALYTMNARLAVVESRLTECSK